ncbi:hypothetical protein Hypma_003167 [Hypsizygus marmoreus]|uniref:Uncharacterized protein n=1 Tax=Hypsizygus marmoreus TaxID=39966 RepID=A0A369JZ62_HYPMA|nr:hypothetical protein Hypma_003167 [Hypsizygus marmoreus]
MEFLSVATAVYGLACAINDWLDQREEKDDTVKQISVTISQIQKILQPFSTMQAADHVERPLFDSVASVGDTMKRTQEHLFVWEYKRTRRIVAFLSPSVVIKQLKDDERQLDRGMMMLLTSIAVVGFVDRRRQQRPRPVDDRPPPATAGSILESISNHDVREFWSGYIGEQISLVPSDEFRARLGIWLKGEISAEAWLTLNLRLDEFGIGGVTPSNLDSFIGDGRLEDVVHSFIKESNAISRYKLKTPKNVQPADTPRLPLLICIDDNPINIDDEVKHALTFGINVVQLTSTALAKAWIDANKEFLKCNDDPSLIRVISDNHRTESTTNPFLNLAAGENILRYLRGHQLKIPVLIYAASSISLTTYVEQYQGAGSTYIPRVCMEYITAFGAGRSDDVRQLKYMMEE